MAYLNRRPELIIIAGPYGSGKTTITQKFLHHKWANDTTYINPDQVAKDTFGDMNDSEAILKAVNYCSELREKCISKIISRYNNSIHNCRIVASIVDRLYLYDNSIDGADVISLFRLSEGVLAKRYSKVIPEWALTLLPNDSK